MSTPFEIKKALEEVDYEHKQLGKEMGLSIYLASKRTGVGMGTISEELRKRKKKNAPTTPAADDHLTAWQKIHED